ncbi:MAG: hypothetical protein AAF456_21700 [Planctomycetota bacterium]
MILRRFICICFYAAMIPTITSSGLIHAQAIDFGRGFGTEVDPEAELAAVESFYQRGYDARIAELRLVCDLNDSQSRKLEVAAKGAIIRAIEIEIEVRRQQAIDMGLLQVGEADPFGNAAFIEDDPFAEDELEAAEGMIDEAEQSDPVDAEAAESVPVEDDFFDDSEIMSISWGELPISGTNIDEIDIWSTALSRTLSDEQRQAFDDHVERRMNFQRETAVSQFIARVDQSLRLTENQRMQLSELVSQTYGEQLRSSYYDATSGWGMNVWMLVEEEVGAQEGPEVDLEAFTNSVSEILAGNESQLDLWTGSFEPELTGNWGDGMMMGGGIF